MILRSVLLATGIALAYALLRGWPADLPVLIRVCLAVLAIVAGLGLGSRHRAALPSVRAKARPPQRLDFATIAGALLAVECGFLWLLCAAPDPLESVALAVERRFRPEAASLRAMQSAPPTPGNWLWTDGTRRPLPRRTDFKPGTKPEVFLRLSEPVDAKTLINGQLYVRAFALGRYVHSGWSPLPNRRITLRAEDDGLVRLAASRPGREILHEVFHPADPDGRDHPFTALQGATAAGIAPLTRIDDGLHLLPPPNSPGGYRYLARSSSLRIEQLPDHELLRPWPDARPELLDVTHVPRSGAEFTALARETAGTGSLKDQLLRLQGTLRREFRYSLTTPNLRDLEPMENFLFGEKSGHCEYFATAGALMARALGIPARVAYGWSGGTWYDAAGLFVFRANEAHAWTEVCLDGHGWVIMDPTPPQTAGQSPQVARPNELPPVGDAAATEDSSADGMTMFRNNPSHLTLALVAGSFLVAGILVLVRVRRHPGGLGTADVPESPGTAAAGYLRAWRTACAARGEPARCGVTLKRQLDRMRTPPPFAADLLAYHYATRYEGRSADNSLERHLTRLIRRWQKENSGINPPSGNSQIRR